MYYRNGQGSAFGQRHFPDRIYNLTDGFRHNRFPARIPWAVRVVRYPGRMLHSLVTGRWVRLSVQAAYFCGYLQEYLFARTLESQGAVSKPAP